MKTFRRKFPAVALAIAWLAMAPLAWTGGRDVPDSQSSGSSASQRQPLTKPPAARECLRPTAVSTVTIGGVSFDLTWSEETGYRLVPSLWSAAASLLDPVDGDRGHCPAG